MAKKNTKLVDLEQDGIHNIVEVEEIEVETIDFRSWYALRSPKIPVHHREEILSADFKARGLKDEATLKEFDDALKMYGIKLD
jgi:hypothetical protein